MIKQIDTGRRHGYAAVRKALASTFFRGVFFLLTIWVSTARAQTPLNTNGEAHRIELSGSFEDFIIPDDPAVTQVILKAKGGDGGIARVERESCTSPGGSGATLSLTLDIGDGPGQVPRGTLLRFIVGGKGENGVTNSDVLGTGFAYAGGGGGTGILIKTPDTTFMNILAVAGGGGGAYIGRIVGFCVNDGEPAEGQGGRDWIEAGDGKGGFFGGNGGSFGDGGMGSEFAGGGGGLLTTGGGVTCIELTIPPTTYQAGAGQKGYPEGGRGGLPDDCIGVLRVHAGGFGFGGGGAGWGAAGGGGGYSGGGAGATTGGGGGGGSFVNAIASTRTITAGASTLSPEDGYIEYQVIRKIDEDDAPVAQCKNISIDLNDSGVATLDPDSLSEENTDSDGNPLTFSVSKENFDCSDVGEQVVILTVTNVAGLSGECEATITITDTQPPVLTCPEDIKVESEPGSCGAVYDFAEWVTATDNCQPSLNYSLPPGSFFEIGETEVQITATDPGGNEANCSFIVKIIDSEAPQVDCPADLTFDCSQADALETLAGMATATDNCEGVSILVEETAIPLTCEGEFSYTRIWIATDAAGNRNSCAQQLTRLPDQTAPECLNCPADIAVSCGNIPPLPGTLDLEDNCDAEPSFSVLEEIVQDPKIACSQYNYEIFRTFLVEDKCGNTAAYVQKITVADDEAPVFECPANLTVSCSQSTAPEDIGAPTVIDNCDPAPQLSFEDILSGNCDVECSIQRIWTATDACGNSSTCIQIISQSNRELIAEALAMDVDGDGISDPLVFGYSNYTLTVGEDALDCVMQWLPHTGGQATALVQGHHNADPATCSIGPNPLSSDGRISNRLLGELLELAIKIRINPEIGKLVARELDCQYSVMVYQTLRPYSDVNSIVRLGNITLSNLYGPFYEPIASAVQCINDLYPLCSVVQDATAATIAEPRGLDLETNAFPAADRLVLYPNPAREELFIHAPQMEGSPVVLRVYNLQGQLATEQRVKEWPGNPFRLSVEPQWRGVYVLKLFVEGNSTESETFIVQRE